LIDLYKKIYGTQDVTNNEFMEWQIKGYILELSGEQVNWAEAAAATARWKMDAEGSGKRGDGMWISGSSGSLQPSGLNGRLFGAKEGRLCSSSCRPGDPSESAVLLQDSLDIGVTSSSCPYGVSSYAIMVFPPMPLRQSET
jgi:hypothetical protein